MVRARFTFCSTSTHVMPYSSRISPILRSTSSANFGDKLAVGSSKSIIVGLRTSAIPIPSIWRCPPLSVIALAPCFSRKTGSESIASDMRSAVVS